MDALETLIAARDLITPPERWTTGFRARFENRMLCDPRDPDAVCFCAVGAIHKFCYDERWTDTSAFKLLRLGMDPTMDYVDIARWNDTHTHAEVLAAFDRAIEFARSGVR